MSSRYEDIDLTGALTVSLTDPLVDEIERAPLRPAFEGAIAHWDASDAETVQHTAGAVTAWRDSIGLQRLISTGAPGESPRTDSRLLNGLNVLSFRGSDALIGDFGSWPTGEVFGILLVVDNDIDFPATLPVIAGRTTFGLELFMGFDISDGFRVQHGPADVYTTMPYMAGPQARILYRNGNELSQSANAGAYKTTNNAGDLSTMMISELLIGHYAPYWFTGGIAEIVLYRDTPGEAILDDARTLIRKWSASV